MSEIPSDFRRLLPKTGAEAESADEPIYHLWVYDPSTDKVHLEHNRDRHAAEHVDHSHLGLLVTHPDRVHGYAYRIRGGFRITDWEHRPVDDPHILRQVKHALEGRQPEQHTGSQVQSRALR